MRVLGETGVPESHFAKKKQRPSGGFNAPIVQTIAAKTWVQIQGFIAPNWTLDSTPNR